MQKCWKKELINHKLKFNGACNQFILLLRLITIPALELEELNPRKSILMNLIILFSRHLNGNKKSTLMHWT